MSWSLSQFSGQRILVTGASGFIGSHLCRRLRGCGAELHCASREARWADEVGLRWWRGDLADTATVREMVSTIHPDLVFHWQAEPLVRVTWSSSYPQCGAIC